MVIEARPYGLVAANLLADAGWSMEQRQTAVYAPAGCAWPRHPEPRPRTSPYAPLAADSPPRNRAPPLHPTACSARAHPDTTTSTGGAAARPVQF